MLLCQKYMQNHTLSATTVPPPSPLKKEGKKCSFISVMQCVDNSFKQGSI